MYAAMPGNTNKHLAMLTANTVATEAISNIRTVAAYVNEERMIDRYARELLKPREKAFRQAVILGTLVGLGQFATMGVNALGTFSLFLPPINKVSNFYLGFWYGAKLIKDGNLNFQDFLAAFQVTLNNS